MELSPEVSNNGTYDQLLEKLQQQDTYHSPERFDRVKKIFAQLPPPELLAQQLRGHLQSRAQEIELRKKQRLSEGKPLGRLAEKESDKSTLFGELGEVLAKTEFAEIFTDHRSEEEKQLGERFLAFEQKPERFGIQMEQGRNADLAIIDVKTGVIIGLVDVKMGSALGERSYKQFGGPSFLTGGIPRPASEDKPRGSFRSNIEYTLNYLDEHPDLAKDVLGIDVNGETKKLVLSQNLSQFVLMPYNTGDLNGDSRIPPMKYHRGHTQGDVLNTAQLEAFKDMFVSNKVKLIRLSFTTTEVQLLYEFLEPLIFPEKAKTETVPGQN